MTQTIKDNLVELLRSLQIPSEEDAIWVKNLTNILKERSIPETEKTKKEINEFLTRFSRSVLGLSNPQNDAKLQVFLNKLDGRIAEQRIAPRAPAPKK